MHTITPHLKKTAQLLLVLPFAVLMYVLCWQKIDAGMPWERATPLYVGATLFYTSLAIAWIIPRAAGIVVRGSKVPHLHLIVVRGDGSMTTARDGAVERTFTLDPLVGDTAILLNSQKHFFRGTAVVALHPGKTEDYDVRCDMSLEDAHALIRHYGRHARNQADLFDGIATNTLVSALSEVNRSLSENIEQKDAPTKASVQKALTHALFGHSPNTKETGVAITWDVLQ